MSATIKLADGLSHVVESINESFVVRTRCGQDHGAHSLYLDGHHVDLSDDICPTCDPMLATPGTREGSDE